MTTPGISTQINGTPQMHCDDGNNKEEESLHCERCGTTLKQFSQSGRFGCPDCYTAFNSILAPVLGSVHRGECHCGRTPDNKATSKRKPEMAAEQHRLLQHQLSRAIATEDYEHAAQIRDQIEQLNRAPETRP